MSYHNPTRATHDAGRDHYLRGIGIGASVPGLIAPVLGARFDGPWLVAPRLGGYGGLGDDAKAAALLLAKKSAQGIVLSDEETANIVDRFLTKPQARDTDVQQMATMMRNFIKPFALAISAIPGVPSNVKVAFINDPFGLICDTIQNARDFFRDLVNRVATRSNKPARNIGGAIVRMTAQRGDSIYRTAIQFIILLGTAWFATHAEALRMVAGLPIDKASALGSLGDGGASAVALAAPVGVGINITEMTAMITAAAGLVGALAPIVDFLLSMASKDDASAKAQVAAGATPASAPPSPTAVNPFTPGGAQRAGAAATTDSSASGIPPIAIFGGAALLALLLLRR